MKINNLISKVSASYAQYRDDCDEIAIKAQKHINWDNNIGCEYFPSDGICLTTTDAHVCPVSIFFLVIEERGKIDKEDFIRICV